MSNLFGFFSDGRKDTSKGYTPTNEGYNALHESAKAVIASGHRLDPNDHDLAREAMRRGKTVEDYLKYDLGQW